MTLRPNISSPSSTTTPAPVDILILGAGWTSTFLIPLLSKNHVSYAATTTTGRDNTIKFIFDPLDTSPAQYARLPSASTVLITFPLRGPGQSTLLTRLYRSTHPTGPDWIQLGSSGIFNGRGWQSETSAYDAADARAVAEDELLSTVSGCVLSLAGLYGGNRDPRDWVLRVAASKDRLAAKTSLHLVHGEDVARAVLALHRRFTPARRWIVADCHVYDWWELVFAWAEEVRRRADGGWEFERWVAELMRENGVRALPRAPEVLGRALDSRAFWEEVGVWPGRGRVW